MRGNIEEYFVYNGLCHLNVKFQQVGITDVEHDVMKIQMSRTMSVHLDNKNGK